MSKNEYIKSPLNYVGGKYKLLPQIISMFPSEIGLFVDLFCGGFNVGINVPSSLVVANDIESNVVDLLQYFKSKTSNEIINEIESLIDKYKLSRTSVNGYEFYNSNSNDGVAKFNKDKYIELRDDYNNGEQSPIMFYTMLIFAFNNQIRFNDKGEFNMPVNKRDFNDSLKKNLIKFIDELNSKSVKFTSYDFRQLKIDKLNKNDFVYIDPPYLITNAAYNERGGWTEQDERDLYELCDKLNNNGIKFALSNVTYHKGRQNDILLQWSKKYIIHDLTHNYSNSNYQTKDRDKNASIEVLVTNYTT